MGQEPAGVLHADCLRDEDQLGGGKCRNQPLGLRCQVQQLGAAGHRRVTDERHLCIEGEAPQSVTGGCAVTACELEDATRLGRERGGQGHRRKGSNPEGLGGVDPRRSAGPACPFAILGRMSEMDEIRRGLAAYRPKLCRPEPVAMPAPRRAAVAMVLRDGDGGDAEVLLIERARRRGDPWSGHMAFPGGRMEPGDPSVRAAASREAREEVGIELGRADVLGRLDDLERRHAGGPKALVISGFVFHHPDPEPLAANEEVEAAFWVPLLYLTDPDRHVARRFSDAGGLTLPGIVVGNPERHVVWGLTYRFLEIFFGAVGQPFPGRWGEVSAS